MRVHEPWEYGLLLERSASCGTRGRDREIALCKSSIPIEAHGFAEMLKKDQQFMDILHLLELSSNLTYGSPYVLLAYSLMGSLSKTHSINKFLRARAEFAMAQQKLETEEKSADKVNDDDTIDEQ